jgi:site-specific DNA recombinase
MNRINELIEAGETGVVIVYKLDRLSRRTIDILNTLDGWEKLGIAFHSITDKIDTKTAAGKFLLTILSALAQMERDLISERTSDALAYKKKNREWCGRVPFGFTVQGTRLIENPEQIEVIQKPKRMKRRGKSYRAISKALSLPLGSVFNMVNNNLKTAKASYLKGLQ